jgi:hypothetical protein
MRRKAPFSVPAGFVETEFLAYYVNCLGEVFSGRSNRRITGHCNSLINGKYRQRSKQAVPPLPSKRVVD